MSSDIKPGDEVVCVDVTPAPFPSKNSSEYLAKLTLGKVYVVASVRRNEHLPCEWVIGVEGIPSPSGIPYGYVHYRFRKVQKKFTGMETLTALLLTPAKEVEHAL